MRRFINTKAFIVALSLLLVIVIALAGTVIVLKNNSEKTEKSYNSRIKEYQSMLEKSKNDNKKLEEENSSLQEEIATLSEKKRLESEAAAAEAAAKQAAAAQTPKAPVVQVPAWTGGKVCYLTFDDGPSENTLKNLETLARYNVKATFFVVGTQRLDLLPNIVAGGHAVGLHSNTHNISKTNQSIYASVDAYYADLNAISEKVKQITGIDTKIIRFPGGSSNAVSKITPGIMSFLANDVQEKGYRYFDWNVSSGDASSTPLSAAQIINEVLKGANGKSHICVLMHDTLAKNATVAALPQIIEGLSAMGFQFETLNVNSSGFHHRISN